MGELSYNGTLNDLKKPDAKKIQIYLSLHEVNNNSLSFSVSLPTH